MVLNHRLIVDAASYQDIKLADAYLLLLWQVCIRHRQVCDQADNYIVSGLFTLYRADESRVSCESQYQIKSGALTD